MREKKRTAAKIGVTAGRNIPQIQPSKLRRSESWAQIATASILFLTFAAAIYGAITAYNSYKAAYNDFQAKARPYLAIEKLEFNEATGDIIYLVIGLTNFGERSATNVSIKELSVCTISPEACTEIASPPTEKYKDTIVYPDKINSIRIEIIETDYQRILKDRTLLVNLHYSFGKTEYWYEADIRLHTDNIWYIENYRGN